MAMTPQEFDRMCMKPVSENTELQRRVDEFVKAIDSNLSCMAAQSVDGDNPATCRIIVEEMLMDAVLEELKEIYMKAGWKSFRITSICETLFEVQLVRE